MTADPGDPTLLPVPADVAFLQAPIAVQNEWRTYYATGAITVVPNSTVPFTRPATPPVVDATNRAVSSTTAQQWGDALMRENAWENWAITANQDGPPRQRRRQRLASGGRGWCCPLELPASDSWSTVAVIPAH